MYVGMRCLNFRTFQTVSSKVLFLTCTKHASNIRMSFIKAFLYDGVYERRSVEQHSLVGLIRVLLGHFLSTMRVTFPQFAVLHLLNLKQERQVNYSNCS